MTCTIQSSGHWLEVCNTTDVVRYAFGPKGAPDLTLTVPLRDAEYVPWGGVGRSIAEAVTFRNGDYAYEVSAGFDRDPEAPKPFGGVGITRGEATVATLTCDPDTVSFVWSPDLWDAMVAVGLEWDYSTYEWRAARYFGLVPAGLAQ